MIRIRFVHLIGLRPPICSGICRGNAVLSSLYNYTKSNLDNMTCLGFSKYSFLLKVADFNNINLGPCNILMLRSPLKSNDLLTNWLLEALK